MTPVERILAAAGLEEVDRPPVFPVMLQQGAKVLNMPLKSYFENPTRLADGQTQLIEEYDHDAVFAIPHVVQDTIPWGAGLNFHDDGPPSVNRMVIEQYEDIMKLSDPDPTANPYLRHTLTAAESLARRFKGDRLIVGAAIGPFSLPSMLMGMNKSLALLINQPEARRQYYPMLMEKMMQYTQRWVKAQFEAGCDLVVIAEGMASATIINESTFISEAYPVLNEFLSSLDGLLALELVGDTLPFMHHVAKLPCAAVLVGGTDPVDKVRRELGRQKLIVGNLNNIKLIHWDEDRVEFEARRAIRTAGPGFILSNQGPEIPWHVPSANLKAMVRAAHRAARPVAQAS